MSSLTLPWCISEPFNVPCHKTPGTKDKQHHLHLPSSGCLRAMPSPLDLLSPRPDKPSVLSCSSQDMASSPANNRPVVGNNSIGLNSWAFAALQVLHGVIEPHHYKHQHPTQNTGQSDRQFLCLWAYSRPDSEYFPQTLEKKNHWCVLVWASALLHKGWCRDVPAGFAQSQHGSKKLELEQEHLNSALNLAMYSHFISWKQKN